MTSIDFGRHSGDYTEHRPGFPPPFYRRLGGLLPLEGARALDLATGPGVIALELAACGAEVLGVDIAPGQVEAAVEAATARGLADRAHFAVGCAERLEATDSSFDLVTAGQCWHWFDAPAVLAEARRVLRPGGLLVVADYSYLASRSDVARDTERLVLDFHPGWSKAGESGMYPERIDELVAAGFPLVEQFCLHHEEEFSHARWRGRIRTCNGVGSGGLPAGEVERFDAALQELLAREHPEPLRVMHRLWCIVARRP